MRNFIRFFVLLSVFVFVSCGTTEKPNDIKPSNSEPDYVKPTEPEKFKPIRKPEFKLVSLTKIELPQANAQIIKGDAKLKTEGGRKIALLIFADEYSNVHFNIDVANDEKLQENLESTLKKNLTFNEILTLSGKNVDVRAINQKIEQIKDKLLPQDTVLIYYYGHGFTFKNEIFFFQYWTKFENNVWKDTLSRKFFHELSHSLKEHEPKSKIILIFDACRPGLDLAPPAPVKTKESLADAEISSCSNGQFAKANIFTPAFCEAIKENDDRSTLSLSEIFTQTAAKVQKLTDKKQMPEFLGVSSIMLRTGKGFKVSFSMHDAFLPDRELQSKESEIKLNSRSLTAPCVFEGVNEGDYVISAKSDGYLWRTETRSLGDADKFKNFDIPMLPSFLIIRGTLDCTNLKGIQPSEILVGFQGKKLKRIDGYHKTETNADDKGFFELRIKELPTEPVLNFCIERNGKKISIGKSQLNILRKYNIPISNTLENVRYQPVEVYDLPKVSLNYETRKLKSVTQEDTIGNLKIPIINLKNPSSKISYESFVNALKAVIDKKTSDSKFFRNSKLGIVHLQAVKESEKNSETERKLNDIAQQIYLTECFRHYSNDIKKGISQLGQYINLEKFDERYINKAKRQLSLWCNTEGLKLSTIESFDTAKKYFKTAQKYSVNEEETAIFKQNLHELYFLKINDLMKKALEDNSFQDVENMIMEASTEVSKSKEIQELENFLIREKQHPILKKAYEEGAYHYRQGNFEVAELILSDIEESLNEYYSKFAGEYLKNIKTELYEVYFKQGLNNLNIEKNEEAFLYLFYAYVNATENDKKVCEIYFDEYFKNPDFSKITGNNETVNDLTLVAQSICENIFLKQKLLNLINPSVGSQIIKCEYLTDHEQKYHEVAKNLSSIECDKFLLKFPKSPYSEEIIKLKEQKEEEKKIKRNRVFFYEIMRGDYSNCRKLTYLTPEVARELSKQKVWLDLNGLTSISKDVARELAKHEGKALKLNGLTFLTVKIARELAKHKGWLFLNGLPSITVEVAHELSNHEGMLDLNGLTSIIVEVARELAKHKGWLFLNGLPSITVEVAHELSNHEGMLDLNGLTFLTVKIARELAKLKHSLHLNGLTSITVEVARELAKQTDEQSFSLDGLPPKIVRKLSKYKAPLLSLSGFTSISKEVAVELAKHKGELVLDGLTSITVEVAVELAKHKSRLYLRRLNSISEDVARELAKHEYTIFAKSHIEKEIQKYK